MDYAGTARRLTSRVAIFLACTFSGGISCRSRPSPRPVATIDVPFAGCAAVVRSRDGTTICETSDPSSVRLFPPPGSTRGYEADAISVETSTGRFALAIRPPPELPWLSEARAARTKGDLDRAYALAKGVLDAGRSKSDVERALAHGLLARIELSRGHADEAFPHFRAAIDLHRAQGRISDAADDSFALAFALHQRSHRYAEARDALDRIADLLPFYPEGRARDPYYRGILAGETGDRRGALVLLREAERLAKALGMKRLERNARSALALEMQELGRAKESLDVLAALERELDGGQVEDVTPCERVEIANDRGAGAILAGTNAREPLEKAIGIAGCADAYLRGFALANLARVALTEGKLDEAEQRLEAARSSVTEPRGTERLAWLELDARILLGRRRANEALAKFEEMEALAVASVLPLSRWSALAGKAEALEALGREKDATAALVAAEEVLDEAALLVPLGEGRGGFLSDRSRTARVATTLLHRAGRDREAAAVARRSIARGLESVPRALRIERLAPKERDAWDAEVRAYRAARRAIDEEAANDWKLPREELARATEARRERERELRAALERAMAVLARESDRDEPKLAEGDLEIAIHPDRDGWLAFATDAKGTSGHAVAAPTATPAEIARDLLAPIRGKIAAARRVRVRAYGAYRKVDVHALPWDDGPLGAAIVVDYPLGVASRGAAPQMPRALVVGNPTGDLPSAEDEARAVARVLGDRGPVMTLLRGDATSKAIADALRTATVLHYAGHGSFGGLEGSESALPLAEGARLTVADILALAPVPRSVVLSGCDAARTETESEGLGLAQAFVAAGAEEVVAPTRPVADALAGKLASLLHAGPPAEPLAEALKRATATLRAEDANADWAAFRAVVR